MASFGRGAGASLENMSQEQQAAAIMYVHVFFFASRSMLIRAHAYFLRCPAGL
jgi:hypothetical protein